MANSFLREAVTAIAVLALTARAWPFCEKTGTSQCQDPTGTITGSYCMNTVGHIPPYYCHGAEGAANATACGLKGDDTSVPTYISEAKKKIEECMAAGTATSCSAECQTAFVDYVTYGDRYVCFPADTGGPYYFQKSRSAINSESDTSACSRIGSFCSTNTECGGPTNGTCVTNPPAPAVEAYCDCKPGFTGLYCGTAYSCPGNCDGHGVCFPSNTDKKENTGKCHCNAGWKGDDCKTPDGKAPTKAPTTKAPVNAPTKAPTTKAPVNAPTKAPTTKAPVNAPTKAPTTKAPTTKAPTAPGSCPGGADCYGGGVCNNATSLCECHTGRYPTTGTDRCFASCTHPTIEKHDVDAIGAVVVGSSSDWACVCDAGAEGETGWKGKSCDQVDDSIGNVTFYFGPHSTMNQNSSSSSRRLMSVDEAKVYEVREAIAYYTSTGSFPSKSGGHYPAVPANFSASRLQHWTKGTAKAEYPWLQHGDGTVKTVLTITFRIGSIAAEAKQIDAATVSEKLSGDSVSNACVKSQSCYDDYDLEASPPAPIDKPSDSDEFWPWLLLIVCILAGFGLCYYYTWRRKAAEQKVQSARDSSTARLIDAAAQDQAELVRQPAQQANPEANGSSQPLKEQSASLEPADDALDINEAVSKEESDRFFDLYDADGSGSVDMKELLEMVAAFKQVDSSKLNQAKIKEVWDADGDGMVTKAEFHQRLLRAAETNPELFNQFRAAAAKKAAQSDLS